MADYIVLHVIRHQKEMAQFKPNEPLNNHYMLRFQFCVDKPVCLCMLVRKAGLGNFSGYYFSLYRMPLSLPMMVIVVLVVMVATFVPSFLEMILFVWMMLVVDAILP